MEDRSYARIRKIVYEQAGIQLGDHKGALVSTRIAGRLRSLQLEDELSYIEYLEKSMEREIVHLLDAISTNVTSFFRESHHFEWIDRFVKQWVSEGQTRFRFWSAACSTGEEPYTLAMTLREATDSARTPLDIRILGTDISTRALEHAETGRYTEKTLRPIPQALRKRFIKTSRVREGTHGEVHPELRKMILFRRMNLSKPPFPMRGPMDAIFCRNVMIYFDRPVRVALLREFHRLLKPGGYLMLGHAESIANEAPFFQRVGQATYQPV